MLCSLLLRKSHTVLGPRHPPPHPVLALLPTSSPSSWHEVKPIQIHAPKIKPQTWSTVTHEGTASEHRRGHLYKYLPGAAQTPCMRGKAMAGRGHSPGHTSTNTRSFPLLARIRAQGSRPGPRARPPTGRADEGPGLWGHQSTQPREPGWLPLHSQSKPTQATVLR